MLLKSSGSLEEIFSSRFIMVKSYSHKFPRFFKHFSGMTVHICVSVFGETGFLAQSLELS